MTDAIRRAMIAAGQDPDEVQARAATIDLDALDEDDWPVPEEALDQDMLGPVDEQLGLDDVEGPVSLTYENLLPAGDVAVYKRVKAQTMQIADEARSIAARLVGGTVGDGTRSAKQFINTNRGQYRLAMSARSDNSTEEAAHDRMGVTATIHMPDPDEMIGWFAEHGLDGPLAYASLVRTLRARFRT